MSRFFRALLGRPDPVLQRSPRRGPGQPTCDRCPGRDRLTCCDPQFPKVQSDEVVLPIMDGYGMKCCDCGLVHSFRFRAVKVVKTFDDGTWAYEELDPVAYRVQLSAQRVDEAPGAQDVVPLPESIEQAFYTTPICSLRFNPNDDDAPGVPDGRIKQAIQADRFKVLTAIKEAHAGGVKETSDRSLCAQTPLHHHKGE